MINILFSKKASSFSFHGLLLEIEREGIKQSVDLQNAYFKMFRDLVGKLLLWTDIKERLLGKKPGIKKPEEC